MIGAPAQASINNKEAILQAARESVDSVMLCSEPFAVAYGLDMLDDVLVIDIGAGTVDLCRMHGTMPEDTDQITLTTAGDFVDERFAARLKEAHPEAQFTAPDGQADQGALRRLSPKRWSRRSSICRSTASRRPSTSPTEMRDRPAAIIVPIRSWRALGQLVASFDPEFQHRLKDRVLLAGGGSQIKGLDKAIDAKRCTDHPRHPATSSVSRSRCTAAPTAL